MLPPHRVLGQKIRWWHVVSVMTAAAVLMVGGGLGVPQASAKSRCSYPAQVLNLTNWMVTLPVRSSDDPGTAREVKQPELARYAYSPYFTATSNCSYAYFRAPVNGVTTSGSKYPRSELREMTNNGRDHESFSSTQGSHSVTVTEAFTHLPNDKPDLVGLQIHDASDDITVFRLEGSNLYITNGDDSHFKLVTDHYSLGTTFQARFEVGNGEVRAYYNGVLQATLPKVFTGGYFKAGAYTQANCTNSSPCSSSNYGATAVLKLSVSHTTSAVGALLGPMVRLLG